MIQYSNSEKTFALTMHYVNWQEPHLPYYCSDKHMRNE